MLEGLAVTPEFCIRFSICFRECFFVAHPGCPSNRGNLIRRIWTFDLSRSRRVIHFASYLPNTLK
jgi:hypothetical protein